MLSAALVGLVLAAEPCEAPRVHDIAPLTAAVAQDKAMAQGFLLAAGACAAPGEACTKARLECASLLNTTALSQQNFDEGIWLRDMLLPYLGGYYPMSRTFPAAPLASDGSCNVDVSTLNAAGQRRASQATRRDGLLSEYRMYQRWADTQWQACKDKLVAAGAKDVAARQAAEQQAAAAAAIAAAAAAKAEQERQARVAVEAQMKQQQIERDAALLREQQARDAAAAESKRRELLEQQRQKESADAEAKRQQELAAAEARRQQELQQANSSAQQKAADAEVRRQQELREQEAKLQQNAREAAYAEQKRRESVEDRRMREAREAERERQEREFKAAEEARIAQEKQRKEDQARADAAEEKRKKEEAEAAAQKKREEEEAARKAKEEAEKQAISERDNAVLQQKAQKQKLLKDAEDQLAAARASEVQKKQAAIDAVSSSPAMASQLVAEAAEASKAREEAEKHYAEAKKQADEMVIDVSHERGGGSLYANFGASAVSGGFGLAGLLGMHFGFWGAAPMNGMASGFELALWGRFLGQLSPANTHTHTAVDALLTGRYYFGHFGLGVALDLKVPVLTPGAPPRFGGGLSLALAFVDNHDTRVVLAVSYTPISNYLSQSVALEWARFITDFEISYKILSIHAQMQTFQTLQPSTLQWQVGGYLGIRYGW